MRTRQTHISKHTLLAILSKHQSVCLFQCIVQPCFRQIKQLTHLPGAEIMLKDRTQLPKAKKEKLFVSGADRNTTAQRVNRRTFLSKTVLLPFLPKR